MTVQVQKQLFVKKRRWRRPLLTCVAIIILIGVAAIWVMNLGSVLSSILSIVFTLLSLLITFLAWQYQPLSEAHLRRQDTATTGSQPPFYEEIEGVTLEVTKWKSALIIYAKKKLRGSTVNLSFGFPDNNLKTDLAAVVSGHKRKGNVIYVAVFSSVQPGNYTIYTDSKEFMTRVSILPGKVEEVDWR